MARTDNRVRVFFGKELRRLREETGLTQEQLAGKLGCTPGWISVMEKGKKISEASARDLDTFYQVSGHFYRLWELAQEVEVSAVVPPGYAEYLEREQVASSGRMFDAYLINGLLQTEAYARAVFSANEFPDIVDKLLAERMQRQEHLTKENAPRLFFIVDEVALRRRVGGPEVMREQFQHLLQVSERPNITLYVIPQDTGYYPGLAGSFTVLGLEDGAHVAYTESAGAGMLITNPARAANYLLRYETLTGYALPATESQALIRKLVEEL